MNECDSLAHWWLQDGPWTVYCTECGADGRVILGSSLEAETVARMTYQFDLARGDDE